MIRNAPTRSKIDSVIDILSSFFISNKHNLNDNPSDMTTYGHDPTHPSTSGLFNNVAMKYTAMSHHRSAPTVSLPNVSADSIGTNNAVPISNCGSNAFEGLFDNRGFVTQSVTPSRRLMGRRVVGRKGVL